MKVALVYDRVNKWGGAESVLLALHELFPEAPLYTSVYNKETALWASAFEVRTSFLQKLPLPKTAHEYYPFLMGIAFESFNFDEFDLVISVTHEFAKAIITKPATKHICYCLTPTGYLWSGYKQYFAAKSELFRVISWPIIGYLRWYDKIVAERPDKYIAISRTVGDRIKKYYGRESEIIYPPVTLGTKAESADKYFLVVSRLAAQKRLDIVVEAFNKLGWPLKIVGIGREEARLRGKAKENIEFLGSLTEAELSRYYENCRALVVPGEEDFGIVAVEAQSYGKPVVAYEAGGALETIVENKTGWFFREQTAESLIEKLKKVEKRKINPDDCVKNAQQFSKERFKTEFQAYIENVL